MFLPFNLAMASRKNAAERHRKKGVVVGEREEART
jgi:hypothetical protein